MFVVRRYEWNQLLKIKPGPLAQVATALITELLSQGNHNPLYLLHNWYWMPQSRNQHLDFQQLLAY